MLENEPNKFKDENFPPLIDLVAQEKLIKEATLYFINIKSILMDLEHSQDYKKLKNQIQKKNLKETHFQSLRRLFKEFSKFDLMVKIQTGNILNSETAILFKKLHQSILKFEKMPTRNLDFEGHVRNLLDPILEYLRDMSVLTEVNLQEERLPKPEEGT